MADSAKWYVVHTYSGYENAVKTSIEKFVTGRGMEDMILRIEVPMETVTEVTDSGSSKEVERKVFPGYVLIKMVMTLIFVIPSIFRASATINSDPTQVISAMTSGPRKGEIKEARIAISP